MSAQRASPYDPVPHSHVVPAGYLRAWAVGKQIAMRRAGMAQSRVIGVKDAGVRRNFYRRRRPTTGAAIYDVEQSLSVCEDAALPVIADIRARWPLEIDAKGRVGQFLALQHLRGDAFQRWHGLQVEGVLDAARSDPERVLTTEGADDPGQTISELTQAMTSDTFRLTQMLKFVRSVATVLTSMHWTLIEFDPNALVTSDHPVIAWPLDSPRRRPIVANDLSYGVLNTLEVFAPLSPNLVLLMSWRDRKSPPAPLRGAEHHAATVNAFVIANAAEQWFHSPSGLPNVARGSRLPLTEEFVPGYNRVEAESSDRRALARELANAEADRAIGNEPLHTVGENRMPD